MWQVANRNSSGAKRGRTDGGRREDDWICPSCGNVNFSFRTTCNRRNCTQPRPADHNTKSTAKPMQPPQGYSSAAPYLGSGAPSSSIYMGVPPYGSSLFNAASMPPYDVQFSGGSAYPYNYGNRLCADNPYRPMHLSATAPCSSGSIIGNGGVYGVNPLMDRYGFGLSMSSAMQQGTETAPGQIGNSKYESVSPEMHGSEDDDYDEQYESVFGIAYDCYSPDQYSTDVSDNEELHEDEYNEENYNFEV